MNKKKNLIRIANVIARTGKSRSSIYRDMKNKTFPASVSIGEKTVAWLESDIDGWIEERIELSKGKSL